MNVAFTLEAALSKLRLGGDFHLASAEPVFGDPLLIQSASTISPR
jgi:hypothetical protein